MSLLQSTVDGRPFQGRPQQVCVIFTNIIDSTNEWDGSQTLMWQCVELHHQILRTQVARFAGFEIKNLGDGFFIVFSDSNVRQALHFCLAVQKALARAEWPREIIEARAAKDAAEGRCPSTRYPRGLMIRMGLHLAQPYRTVFDQVVQRADMYGLELCAAHRVAEKANGDEIAVSDPFIAQLYRVQNPGEDINPADFTDAIRYRILYKEMSRAMFDIRSIGRPPMKGISNPEFVSIITHKR